VSYIPPRMSAARRFAIVSPNYYPTTCGVGDHSMRLAAELRERGFDAEVFTRLPVAPNPEDPEVRVNGVSGRGPLALAASLAWRISAGGFSDVVIQYTAQMWNTGRFGSPGVALLAAILKRRGLRVALIMHEPFTPWNKRRPDLLVGALLLRAQLALTMKSCATLFVTTESRREVVAQTLLGLLPCPTPDLLRVGPNALPVLAAPVAGRHRVGLFSTLAVGKRFDVVFEAFEEIFGVYPDAELVLTGDLGDPESPRYKALAARIASSPAAARIQVTGRLSLPALASLVSTLDLYLFPMNTGANTRSGTLPVALGSGVPVVAISSFETDAVFVDGQNILFAESLSGPDFARAALRVFADPALARRLGEGGRRLYEEQLAWKPIVDTFLSAVA
jgi:glycosyltransferase involved in cell wall biosynthesis